MRRLSGLFSILLVVLVAGGAFAQDAPDDDVDNGIPDSVKQARARIAEAAKKKAAEVEAEKKAAAAKVEGAKPDAEVKDAKPVDLKKTTVPGANRSKAQALKDKVRAAAAKAKAEAPAKKVNTADAELPAWAPAPEAITPVDHSGNRMNSTQEWAASHSTSVGYPMVEHHGYLRMRMDLFHNFDLDTFNNGSGSSPVLPPLTELDQNGSQHPETPDHRYGRGADSLASANMRLRWEPTLHINENLRVHTTMDLLDNLVLGSTPDVGRADVPIEMFSEAQTVPASGVNAYQDSIRVKRLWGEWRNVVGVTSFGRMANHWGMGMMANAGNCLDCDFGDVVDRITHTAKLFDTYLTLAWDFPSEGFVGHSGVHDNRNQPFGQAHDFDQRDDVNQYIIAIFNKPVSKRELEMRQDALNRRREFVWDWGVYQAIRNQTLSSTSTTTAPPTVASQVQLVDVQGFTYTPDLWLNFEYRPRAKVAYQLQFEAAGIFGVIEEVPDRAIAQRNKTECADPAVTNLEQCDDIIKPRRRDIQQWGAAVQFDVRNEQLEWGIHTGAASGDSAGFGVLDRSPIQPNSRDDSINNFRFDRDYIVDLILFREIIGGVTNAAYFKPYLAYNFVDEDSIDGVRREKWGFKLSGMYAQALVAEATPGEEAPLGLEFDLELYMHEISVFKWSIAYGILFPMSGLDALSVDEQQRTIRTQPNTAQTLQMNLGFQF